MLLAIDVGNSNTVLGLFDGKRLKKSWRIESTRESLRRITKKISGKIDGIIISSVVPSLDKELIKIGRRFFGVKPLLVNFKIKMPIRIKTKKPREVGADRIVNAAAHVKYHVGAWRAMPLLIIDFGTATTFDVVTAKGEYIGGAIAPGIGIANEALAEKCAKLPKVPLQRPRKVVGRTTIEAIRSGVYLGYAGLVDGIVARIKREFGGKRMKVIATGGLAPFIAPATETIESVDPHLTLKGLQILYEWNKMGKFQTPISKF